MKKLIVILVGILCVLAGCMPRNVEQAKTDSPETALSQTSQADHTADETQQSPEEMTMKEAFSMLEQMSGMDDLQLYSYNAFEMDSNGCSGDFWIVGYSATTGKNYFLSVDADETELEEINDPDLEGITFYDIEQIKDSSEIVCEAIAVLGKWDDTKGVLNVAMFKENAETGAMAADIGLVDIAYLK